MSGELRALSKAISFGFGFAEGLLLIAYSSLLFVQFSAACAFTREMIKKRKRQLGFTLIELIVATAIMSILAGMAVPLARVTIKREGAPPDKPELPLGHQTRYKEQIWPKKSRSSSS